MTTAMHLVTTIKEVEKGQHLQEGISYSQLGKLVVLRQGPLLPFAGQEPTHKASPRSPPPKKKN